MIIYLPSQWCKGYVLALNSPLCCGSASCYGSLFMKHSSAALIQTELRGHAEKKKKKKKKKRNLTKLVAMETCRPYLFQMICSADWPSFSYNCFNNLNF